MIIGLTGKNGSGKGEVARFLKKAGYQYYSLSDAIRMDLEKTGDQITRDSLTVRGNELREKFGAGVLAERILKLIFEHENAVIDSIRNPVEAETLKSRKEFFLIDVTADLKIRFERLKSRARENDPVTYDDFVKCEKRENDGKDMIKQQLDLTANFSDMKVENNGSVEALYDGVRKVINKIAKSIKRPGWDEYFMDIAAVVASRGNCLKRKNGAVIVKDKRIISTGYNGTPRSIKNCNEGGCPRCNSLAPSGEGLGKCYCSHSEENAIVQAAYHGVSTKDAIIYTTFSPCLLCSKLIINSGIKEVVYNKAYTIEEEPLALLKEAGIKARQIK